MSAWPAPPGPFRPPAGGYFFRRLVVTALAAAMPVAALFAWWLQLSAHDLQRQSTATVLAHSTETARRVESTLARLDVVADVLLARDEIAGMDAARCGSALRDMPRVDPLILNAGLFDLQGRALCLARSPAVMPPNFSQTSWYQQALAQERRLLTRPYYSPASQRRSLSMASPVRDATGRRIGILGMSIDLERLSATLPNERLPEGAAVAIVAPDGTLIARNLDPRHWIGTQAPPAFLTEVPAGAPSGSFQARGFDGVLRTQGHAAVGREGWRIYTGVPTADVLQPMEDSRRQGLAVLAAAVLLGVAASWIGARRLVRPLQGLAATARRLAAGDDSARADESRPGEVGQLAAEFNHMVRNLVESRNDERASTARFLQLFNVIPVAAAVVDGASGRLLEANDSFCRALDAERGQVLGRTLRALGLAPDDAVADEHARLLRETGEVRGLEATLRDPHGGERQVLLHVSPIDWHGGPAWLCAQIDITERRQAERLQAANAAKTEFLSRMSHELRTPLHAILGLGRLLEQQAGPQLPPPQQRQLGLLRQAGEQLLALIDDVLDVARIESGGMQIRLEPLDLGRFVDEARQLSEDAARSAGVTLELQADAAAPMVLADATRLRQILLNLLSNAVKYNRPGGRVLLQLRHGDGMVALQVQDTGIGMSAAQLQALFRPFNRLGRERGPVPGTGIGLVLTRSLVQLLAGTLDVQSEEGAGTTVTLQLPAAAAAASDPPAAADGDAAEPAAGPTTAPRGTVLYIEDNAVNALIVEQMLAPWAQVRLHVAPDGARGLALATELRPDVVLLDMQLPDMEGMQVLQALRAGPATRAIPVIVLSASTMPDEVAAARAAGADGFWAKPFDFKQFLDGLRSRLPAG